MAQQPTYRGGYEAYPFRGPKEPSALERLQSWWNSFGGQPLPPADTSTRTDSQNIPELGDPPDPTQGLISAGDTALSFAPGIGDARDYLYGGGLIGEGWRQMQEGGPNVQHGMLKLIEGVPTTLLGAAGMLGFSQRPLVGLVQAGAEYGPTFYSRLAKHLSETQRGKATGGEWMMDLAKEEGGKLVPNPKAGVKIAELEETGIKGLLEANLEKTFTKKELQAHADANAIQVEEVMYGQMAPEFKLVEDRSGIENELMGLWTKAEADIDQSKYVWPPFKVGENKYGRRTAHTVVDPISGDSVVEYDKIEDAQAEVNRLNLMRPREVFRDIFEKAKRKQADQAWEDPLPGEPGFVGDISTLKEFSRETGLSRDEAKRVKDLIRQLDAPQEASISPNTFATREEAEKAVSQWGDMEERWTVGRKGVPGDRIDDTYPSKEEAEKARRYFFNDQQSRMLGYTVKPVHSTGARYKIIEGERKVPTHLEGRNLQLEGAREYRELVLKFPDTDPPIFPHLPAHHPVDNPILHLRFNERTGPEGERMLFIEELQSDWGQRGQHLGWTEPGAKTKIDELKREIEVKQADLEAFGHRMLPGHWRRSAQGWPSRGLREEVVLQIRTKSPKELETEFGLSPEDVDSLLEIPRDIHRLRDRVGELENMRGPTKAPIVSKTDTWTDLGLRRMLRYAVDNGYSSIGVSDGATQLRYWPAAPKGLADYYDKVVPNRLNKIAKSLGGKAKVQTKDTDILVPADEFGDRAGEWEASFDLDTPPFEADVHRLGLAPGEGPEVEVFRVRNHPDAEEGVAKAIIVERVGGRDEYPETMIDDYIRSEWESGDWGVIQLKEDPDLFGDEIAEGLGEKYAVIDPNGEIFNPQQGGVDNWGYDSRDRAIADLEYTFQRDAEMMTQDELAERLGIELRFNGEIHLYEAPDHFLADHPDFEVLDSNGNPVGPGEEQYIDKIIEDYINNTNPTATFEQADIEGATQILETEYDLYAVNKYLRRLKGKTEADKVKIRTLEITDKMKESILKGMPLLAGAGVTAGLLSEQQRQQAPQSLIY